MAKEITLKIKLDGGKKVEAEIDDIGDGLHELAVSDAKAAKEALDRIDSISLNQIKSQIKSVGDTLQSVGGKIKSFGQGITDVGQKLTIGLTAPILALTFLIGSLGITYESALNTFQAVTKASTQEMDLAAKKAKELGADLTLPATSAKDAALAMAELGKAGFTANQSMAAAKGVLQLAAAGQLDEAKAAEIAANALNSFSLEASEATRVADLLAAASNASSAEVTDVAESFQQASATFSAAKVPIEDLTTAIALMANAGIKGSDAGTSLKTFLSSIQTPSTQGAETLKKLGISVYDLQGRLKPLPDIIGQFEKSLDSLTDQQKAEAIQNIFGADASRAAQILFKNGVEGFEKIKQAVTQTGAAADLAAAKTKGVGGAFESLKSQAETIGITIYDAVKGPVEQGLTFLAEKLGMVSDYLSKLAENNPEIIQIGAVFLGLLAVLGPVLVVLGIIITAVGGFVIALGGIASVLAPVVAGIGSFIALVGAAGLGATLSAIVTVVGGGLVSAFAAAALPILAVVVGLGYLALAVTEAIAVAVLLYAAYQANFGGLRDFVDDVFIGIKGFITSAMTEIISFVNAKLTDIYAFWAANGADITKSAKSTYDFLASIVKTVLDSIRAFWAVNGSTIVAIASVAWNAIKLVVSNGINIILNVIRLVSAVINGDWSTVWASAKQIVSSAIKIIASLVLSLYIIVANALKLAVTAILSASLLFYNAALKIGEDIVKGLVNGIANLASQVYEKAKSVATSALNMISGVFAVQSPSRETFKIGQYVGEGLALGIENKTQRAVGAAKKLANSVLAELKDAVKEFAKLAGASPDAVQTITQTDRVKAATSAQSDIIKLRNELNLNQYNPLPSTVADTEEEIRFLQRKKEEAEAYTKSLDDLRNGYDDVQKARRAAEDAFENKLTDFAQEGEKNLTNLYKEIDLLGVTDEWEKRRIENYYDILALRQQMANDGYGQSQIDEAAEALRIAQATTTEARILLSVKKQIIQANDLVGDLQGQLDVLRKGNIQLSEYEKTLRKINTVLKDISPAQKEQLLILAQQIDAQKAYNEAFNKTYDFVRSTFEILTDSGKSFGDKMREIFGGILSHFKKMILDMVTAWLTSKLMKIFNGGGQGSGSGGGGFSLGGIFDSIKGIFGGGSRSGGSSGAGGGRLNELQTRLSAGSGTNANNLTRLPNGELAYNVNASSSGGGVGLAGGLAIASVAGNILGGLIGGKAGSVISAVASGVGTGAMIGSIIPGVGTVIGAVVGGAIGFLSSIFGSPKQKIDKKENMPKLEQGFADALKQLREIAADRNAIFSDPEGAISKATEIYNQISSGFGIKFESKKYQGISKNLIEQKKTEAKQILDEITGLAGEYKNARLIDQQLNSNFATGAYMSPAFLKQFKDYRRRNGMLPGTFTGTDSLPSMLAPGEMVLNPFQIEAVRRNAGFDAFQKAGIPGYADGFYNAPPVSVSTPSFSTPSSPSAAPQINFQPRITVVMQGEGISNLQIKGVLMDGVKYDADLQDEMVKSYDKRKPRNRQ